MVDRLRETDLLGNGTETEARMVIGGLRYTLLRTHDWDEEVIDRVGEAVESGEVTR